MGRELPAGLAGWQIEEDRGRRVSREEVMIDTLTVNYDFRHFQGHLDSISWRLGEH